MLCNLQKQDQVEVFRSYLEKHRFHIDKLETIMRLVDNDALQLSQVRLTTRESVSMTSVSLDKYSVDLKSLLKTFFMIHCVDLYRDDTGHVA